MDRTHNGFRNIIENLNFRMVRKIASELEMRMKSGASHSVKSKQKEKNQNYQ